MMMINSRIGNSNLEVFNYFSAQNFTPDFTSDFTPDFYPKLGPRFYSCFYPCFYHYFYPFYPCFYHCCYPCGTTVFTPVFTRLVHKVRRIHDDDSDRHVGARSEVASKLASEREWLKVASEREWLCPFRKQPRR